jgi:hypothetical protein
MNLRLVFGLISAAVTTASAVSAVGVLATAVSLASTAAMAQE